MSQLLTLTWLKWKLLKNSLRSSKAVFNQVATVLGMLAALMFALLLALGLGVMAYVLSQPGAMAEVFRRTAKPETPTLKTEFIFFSILAVLYLMWATVPLSLGSNKQFDAGRLLMYPISLRKLFAIDYLSEITTLQSVFALPAIFAIAVGAGLGSRHLTITLLGALPAAVFGIALSKWLSTTIGLLVRRKRARGETIIALVGAVAGIGGALAGQVGPIIFKHAESLKALRWSPPGSAAVLLTGDASDPRAYLLAFISLSAYAIILIAATYWMARRAALGLGGATKRRPALAANPNLPIYTGWELPLLSSELSAIVEKELRYATRNAQLRMMAIMPLILIVIRLVNSNRLASSLNPGSEAAAKHFMTYGSGLLATGGVLYVFLVLAGLSCNQFAFEEGGMRTLILAPVERRTILMGKNIAVTIITLVFSSALLLINELVFRDLTPAVLLFVALSFVSFAATMSMLGNGISMRFAKRMEFGKRLNLSGVAGLLLIPLIVVLAIPPMIATVMGYYTRSRFVEYATLVAFGTILTGSYMLVIRFQGRKFQRREIEILEAVREPNDL
jgi:hypothetical protein